MVPLDGSPLAEYALHPAIRLARPAVEEKGRGELVLLHVPVHGEAMVPLAAGGNMYWAEAPDAVERRRKAYRQAEGYIRTIRVSHESPRLAVVSKVIEGDVAGVILDTAEAEEIDLIVMGTHGRSGVSRWIMGSVTERVLHGAPCPVLAVRSDEPLQHMLITLDGSPLAERVLPPALAVAEKLGCHVTLLRVEQPPDYSPTFVHQLESVEAGLGEQYLMDIAAQPGEYLEQLISRFRPRNLSIQGVVTHGPVAQSILEFVEYHDVDLIAMSTHGRSGLQRWVYGSITEKVLRNAPCAMLVVRPW
jgi:nucleotide-binding universal stress UspA family protein